jgi:hypothetical protein
MSLKGQKGDIAAMSGNVRFTPPNSETERHVKSPSVVNISKGGGVGDDCAMQPWPNDCAPLTRCEEALKIK